MVFLRLGTAIFFPAGLKFVSARRNELQAELFQRSHRIEKWGHGIKMILEREPQTEFEEVGTVQFVATFRRKNLEAAPSASVGENVGETTQKILELITINPGISRVELAAEIGITADGIKYQLDKLRKQGMLKRVGPDKGGGCQEDDSHPDDGDSLLPALVAAGKGNGGREIPVLRNST